MLSEWLDDFCLDMQRRGLSERTVGCYRLDMQLFLRWLGERSEITLELLEAYQCHLMLRLGAQTGKPLTAASRNRHGVVLRSFFRFLKKSGRRPDNPAAALESARQPKRLPKAILSVAQVDALIAAVRGDSPVQLRDRAVLEVLYGTGVRRAELFALKLGSLRLEENLVHVLGKGNRERVVPLGRRAVAALRRYLASGRRALLGPEGHQALFVSAHHGGPLGDQEMLRNLQEYAQAAGLKKRLAFHIFRHSVATHLLNAGADIRRIQEFLGHSKLDTTALYTRVDVVDLQAMMRQFHPREGDCA